LLRSLRSIDGAGNVRNGVVRLAFFYSLANALTAGATPQLLMGSAAGHPGLSMGQMTLHPPSAR